MNRRELSKKLAVLVLLLGCLLSISSTLNQSSVSARNNSCDACYQAMDEAIYSCYDRCGDNENCFNHCMARPQAQFENCLLNCTW